MTRKLRAEELSVGEVITLGSRTLGVAEIVAFAQDWDPQDFHTEKAAAARGHFGGVIASGLHTMGVLQRLSVLGALHGWDVIAGRTIRDVQFTLAVRAGMVLDATLEVVRVVPVDENRALVTTTGRITSDGRPVLRMEADAYVRRVGAEGARTRTSAS